MASDSDDDDASTIVDDDDTPVVYVEPQVVWQQVQDLLDTPPMTPSPQDINPQDGTEEDHQAPPALMIPDIYSDSESEHNPEDYIYNTEMLINMFLFESHPAFVSDILEHYEEGEYIHNQELYDILSFHNLAIPGFEDYLDPEIVEPLN